MQGSVYVVGCKILNNLGHSTGGGIYTSVLTNSNTLYPSIVNCLVANNTSGSNGGGINAANNSTTREYGNRIINCTVVRNTTTGSTSSYPGIYSQNANFVMNTIIWGNLAETASVKRQFYSSDNAFARFINVAIQDLVDPDQFTGGASTKVVRSGLIALSPDNTTHVKFISPTTNPGVDATGWETANWNISDMSVCAQQGVASFTDAVYTATAPTTEIRGKSRPATPSIGAYENDGVYSSINNLHIHNNIMVVNNDIITDSKGLIKVYSLSGKELISQQIDGYFTTDLLSGIYVIRFIDNLGQVSSLKCVIR